MFYIIFQIHKHEPDGTLWPLLNTLHKFGTFPPALKGHFFSTFIMHVELNMFLISYLCGPEKQTSLSSLFSSHICRVGFGAPLPLHQYLA